VVSTRLPAGNPEERQLRLHRLLLLWGGGAYFAWWFFVRFSLPDAFNPFGSRVAAVACFFAVYGASFVSSSVARRIDLWLAGVVSVTTLHYFYLFDRNSADLNWVVGAYITVMAVCAILQTSRSLLIYSGVVGLLSAGMLVRGHVDYVVFLPGMLTSLLLANLGLHSRLRLHQRLDESTVALYRELGERKRAQAEMARANRELESFSYSVAHDLRTPLRAMGGFSEVLLEDHAQRLDDEAKGHLQRIVDAADTMGKLIDALLGLARLTRKELRREPVDLSALARAVVRPMQDASPKRVVEVVIAPDLRVEGDPQLLRALLDNLLGNAWKFTEKRSSARIELGREEKDGAPAYFVRDNGAGFDMAHAARLFAAFQRLHGAEEYAGTGIGLATVQRIVERHGGSVWAEGAVGEGATFFFTLEPTLEGAPELPP
jgi:signal transduction histidine kinase